MSDATTRINAFRHAVAATIKTVLPELRSCEAQFGRFDLEDLERRSIRMPGVRVAVIKAGLVPTAEDFDARLNCAAFIITEGKDRDDAGWAVSEAIGRLLVPSQLWGIQKMSAPSDISISPLTSARMERTGVTLLAVEWVQTLRHINDADIFTAEGYLIEELYINDELADYDAGDADA